MVSVSPSVYFSQLPRQTRLPDPADPGDRHDPRFPVATGRVEHVLQQPELLRPSDERGLDRHPVHATPLGDHPQGPPRVDGGVPPLHGERADFLEGDGTGGGAEGRLAYVDGSRIGGRLKTGGRIHHVARDHALRTRRPAWWRPPR